VRGPVAARAEKGKKLLARLGDCDADDSGSGGQRRPGVLAGVEWMLRMP